MSVNFRLINIFKAFALWNVDPTFCKVAFLVSSVLQCILS